MSKQNRRDFLKTTAASAALIGGAPLIVPSGSRASAREAPSERIRFACIGAGGRGRSVCQEALGFGELVAICDADLAQAKQAQADFKAEKAEISQDYRRVLDRKDVDAVIVAVPDHWHTKINVEACRAGKDVYGEKPLTLTIEEGKLLRKTVAETGRVFQVGTQQRSEKGFQTAVELVRNGRIGKLRSVWVAVPFFTTKGGPYPEQPVPEGLDWDLYQGQAPLRPYTKTRTQGVWRWWYEYAGGIVTDWGNHHIDIAHWGMDRELSGPVSVEARGLFPNEGKADCYNTPDRFFSRMVYPDGLELLYFAAMKDLAVYGEVEGHVETDRRELDWLFSGEVPDEIRTFDRNGIMFLGERGRIFVNRGGLYGKAVDELAKNPLPEDGWKVRPSENHVANFFDCIRSRKEPVGTVAIEHRTVTACHLTNLSIRLGGRKLQWDPDREEIIDDTEAKGMQSRPQREPYTIS